MKTKKIFLFLFFFILLPFSLLADNFQNGPSIVFVHIGSRLPNYLETAIKQARLFNTCNIILIANEQALLPDRGALMKHNVSCIACETLTKTEEHKQFLQQSKLDKKSREGFWNSAVERFFYLQDFQQQYHAHHIIHLESDNMLYVDVSSLLPIFIEHYPGLAVTLDNDDRCIPGFVYIRDAASITHLAQFLVTTAAKKQTDMLGIARYHQTFGTKRIKQLPIIMPSYANSNPLISPFGHRAKNKEAYYSHIDVFTSIFDAAALGQFLGGIDPRNGPSKPGFINESCVFNPSLLTYEWKLDGEGRKVPYASYQGHSYRINNLHIHSKKLSLFLSSVSRTHSRLARSSAPYLSGDTFRSFCDFYFDEITTSFDPKRVRAGDIIFVKSDLLHAFFSLKHPYIEAPYILISHNSDDAAPGGCQQYLDDKKLIAWFAQNVTVSHPKLHPIPIGIANPMWKHGDVKTLTRCRQQVHQNKREHLLYMNFSNDTYPERKEVYKKFAKKRFCLNAQRKPWDNYLIDLTTVKFVLSPRGNGLDCHRTWEAIYMGAIPIVKTSAMDPVFKDLPVVIVSDWDEVTEPFLQRKYAEMQIKKYALDKLFAPYWLTKIQSQFPNS